jgi:uncharacterized protein (TIGR03437 family)
MKTYGLKTVVLAALILLGIQSLAAQPTLAPSTPLSFSYQVNSSTLPAAQKIVATLPKSAITGYTLTAGTASVSPPEGWLTVTPNGGSSPLTLTVTVNPTGLSPGSYTGQIAVGTNPATSAALVSVTLSISNPPSSITVTPASTVTNYTPGVSGTNPVLAYNYTTGQSGALPSTAELDVASNGGVIPFTVLAASGSKTANWLRVNVSNDLPKLQTSGIASSGSYVPIYVTIDYASLISLNVGPYSGTITFTNIASSTVAAVYSVSLNVSAGPPTITSIFPSSVTAAAASGRVSPVVTIYGDNFFNNSSVQLTPDGSQPLPALTPTLLSRQVLQATLNPSYLTKPGTFTLTVANPSTLNNPTPQQYSVPFTVTDGTVPTISTIVNAASYLKTATWKGTAGLDPVPAATLPGSSAVSPRELIAIFGQSIGPSSTTSSAVLTVASTTFPSVFPSQVPFPYVASLPTTTSSSTVTYKVIFKFANQDATILDPVTLAQAAYVQVPAPIIMVSSNQVNAVIPVPPSAAFTSAAVNLNTLGSLGAWVQVTETPIAGSPLTTDWFPVTYVPEIPGVFTFGGLGAGQAAVLNYDATAGYTINSAKNPAPKGSTISMYVTGMGDLTAGATVTVTDSSSSKLQASQTFPLEIIPAPAATPTLTATPMSINIVQNTPSTTTLQAVGGDPPYTWSASSGMPAGMTLSSSGQLSGTPTTIGIYTLDVSVTDNDAITPVAATYIITITAPTVTVTTSALVPGVQGVAYSSATLTATGGKAPYNWSATGLPPGLTLSSAGILTGTPTTAGPYTPVFTATDSSVQGVSSTPAHIPLDILVSGMTVTTQSVPNGVINVPYVSTTLQQQGGTAPVTWSQLSLPLGLSLSTGGVLSGTPTVAGATTVTVLATDRNALTASFSYHINVASPLSVTTLSLPSSSQSITYPALVMQATGGTPPYTWTATGLPLGMTISSSGVVSGVPTLPFCLPLPDGAVAMAAVSVADNTYRVEINGQAAVTSYAGASAGSVAGLTQINAIVPPTAPTGASIPLVVYIGKSTTARASQLSVTLAVQ